MLLDEIEATGLKVNETTIFRSVWRDEKNERAWNQYELFATSLQNHSVIHSLFGLQNHDLSGLVVLDELEMIENTLLASSMRTIAEKYGHGLVNEVHLFLALLEHNPFDRQFGFLEEEHKRIFDKAAFVDRYLDKVKRGTTPKDLEAALKAPKFVAVKLTPVLDTYLSSRYYPFGIAESKRYYAEQQSVQSKRAMFTGSSQDAIKRSSIALAVSAHSLRRIEDRDVPDNDS